VNITLERMLKKVVVSKFLILSWNLGVRHCNLSHFRVLRTSYYFMQHLISINSKSALETGNRVNIVILPPDGVLFLHLCVLQGTCEWGNESPGSIK